MGQTASNAHNNVKNITLQNKLKVLSAKAYDVKENINNAELSGIKKRKREVEEWLKQVKSIEQEVDNLGHQLESQKTTARLTAEVDYLIGQSQNFGDLVVDVCENRGDTLWANEMVDQASHDNLERVLALLESGNVSRVGVYGVSGVGKTNLAKHINNRLLQQSHRRVLWIIVSREFTITSLQDKIAHLLGANFGDEDDEEKRAARLYKAFSQMKNSVLVLDDVWEYIDMLKVGCHISVECCRLIITTQSLKVCRQIHCQEVITVNKLGKDEAWKLFSETLGNQMVLSPRIEEIAKSIANECDGLPQKIISMAVSMRGDTSIHTWINALAELKDCVVGQEA